MSRNNSAARRAQRHADALARATQPIRRCPACGRRHATRRLCWNFDQDFAVTITKMLEQLTAAFQPIIEAARTTMLAIQQATFTLATPTTEHTIAPGGEPG